MLSKGITALTLENMTGLLVALPADVHVHVHIKLFLDCTCKLASSNSFFLPPSHLRTCKNQCKLVRKDLQLQELLVVKFIPMQYIYATHIHQRQAIILQ